MLSLREKAQACIKQHVALATSGRSRYLVDENGQSVELPSPPPLPPWMYRIAKGEGELSDGDNRERDKHGQTGGH